MLRRVSCAEVRLQDGPGVRGHLGSKAEGDEEQCALTNAW